MNDEKREAMIEALQREVVTTSSNFGERRTSLEITADFALAQMRPLEDRIAELERQLAVAVEALEYYADANYWHNGQSYRYDRVITGRAEHGYETARRALAAAGKPDEAEVK